MSDFSKYSIVDFQARAISKPIIFGQNHHVLWQLSKGTWIFDCRIDTSKIYHYTQPKPQTIEQIYEIVNECITDGLSIPIEIVLVVMIELGIELKRVNQVESEIDFPKKIVGINLDLLTLVIRLRLLNNILNFADFKEYATGMKQIYKLEADIDPTIQFRTRSVKSKRFELFQIEKLILNGVYSRVFTSTPLEVKFRILKEETRKFLKYGLNKKSDLDKFLLYVNEVLSKRTNQVLSDNYEWVEDALILSCIQLCERYCLKSLSWFAAKPDSNQKVNKIQQIVQIETDFKDSINYDDVHSSIENYYQYIHFASDMLNKTKTVLLSNTIESLVHFSEKYMTDIYLATYDIVEQDRYEENTIFTRLLKNISMEFTKYCLGQTSYYQLKLYNKQLLDLLNLQPITKIDNIPIDKLDKYIKKKILNVLCVTDLSSMVIIDDEIKSIVSYCYINIIENIFGYGVVRFKHVNIINDFINCFQAYERENRVQIKSLKIPSVPYLKDQNYTVTGKEFKLICSKLSKVTESLQDLVLGKFNVFTIYAQLFQKQSGLVNIYIKKYRGEFSKSPSEVISEVVNIENIQTIRQQYNDILLQFQQLTTDGLGTFKKLTNRFRFLVDFKFKLLRLFKLSSPNQVTKLKINNVEYAMEDIILEDLEKPKPNFKIWHDQFMDIVEFRTHYSSLMQHSTELVKSQFMNMNLDIELEVNEIIQRYQTIDKLNSGLVIKLFNDRSNLMTKIIKRSNQIVNSMRNINKIVQLSTDVIHVDFTKQNAVEYLKSINVNQYVSYANDLTKLLELLFRSSKQSNISDQYQIMLQIQFILDSMTWSIEEYLRVGVPCINSGISIIKNLHVHWNNLRYQTNDLKNYKLLVDPSTTIKLDNNTKQLEVRERIFRKEFLSAFTREYGLVHDKIKSWLSSTSIESEPVMTNAMFTTSLLFFRKWLYFIQKAEGYIATKSIPELNQYTDLMIIKESILNIISRNYNKKKLDVNTLITKIQQMFYSESILPVYLHTLELVNETEYNVNLANSVNVYYAMITEKHPDLKKLASSWKRFNEITSGLEASASFTFQNKLETIHEYMNRISQVLNRQILRLNHLKIFLRAINKESEFYGIYKYFENDPNKFLRFYLLNGMYLYLPKSFRVDSNSYPNQLNLFYTYVFIQKQVRNSDPELLEFINYLLLNHELIMELVNQYKVDLTPEKTISLDNKELFYRERFQTLNLQWRQFEAAFLKFSTEFDVAIKAILTSDFSKQKEQIDKNRLLVIYFTFEALGSKPFDDKAKVAYDMYSSLIKTIWKQSNLKIAKYNELIYTQVLFKEDSSTNSYNEIFTETKRELDSLFTNWITDTLKFSKPGDYKTVLCQKLELAFTNK